MSDISKVVARLARSGDKRKKMSDAATARGDTPEFIAQSAAAYVAWDLADALCQLEMPNENGPPPTPQPEGKE